MENQKNKIEEPDFEAAMKRLNEIAEDLEAGDKPLEESLKLYEEGIRLAQGCSKRLEAAQGRIEVLMRGSSGELEVAEADTETLKPKSKKKSKK